MPAVEKIMQFGSNSAAYVTSLWERLESIILSLRFALILGCLISYAAMVSFGFGNYLNNYLFFQPVLKLRALVDAAPKLDDQFRLVLLEDKSLKKIGKQPTFEHWHQISQHLFDLGFEKVFLLGIHNLKHEIGQLGESGTPSNFYTGSVVVSQSQNTRAVDAKQVLPRLFVNRSGSASDDGLKVADYILAPLESALDFTDKVGHLNILSNYAMPIGYAIGDSTLLPNLGLLVVDGLQWNGGQAENQVGPIPMSEDGTVYIDYVKQSSIKKLAVPISPFYNGDKSEIKTELSNGLKARLNGGKIGVLVPDAYTGARFIDSPTGKVLSYNAIVSIMNNTLHHGFMYRPFPYWLAVLMLIPFLFYTLIQKQAATALTACGAIAFSLLVISSLCLTLLGWVLPCAQWTVLCLTGFTVRFIAHVYSTVSEKLSLKKDLELGRVVQGFILPSKYSGQIGNWEYKVVYRPFGAMAGDWFQVYNSGEDTDKKTAIVAIGDGVGKGPSAALSTAVIAGVWNNQIENWRNGIFDLEKFVLSMDRTLLQTFKGEQNSTLSLAMLNENSITVTSCASPKWLKITAANGQANSLKAKPANPIGFHFPSDQRQVHWIEESAEPGDVFMAYTDGVMDGFIAAKRFRVGLKKSPLQMESDNLFETIEQRAIKAGEKDVLPDDFTLLLIRRIPEAKTLKKAS